MIAFFIIALCYRFIDQHFIHPIEEATLSLSVFLILMSILGVTLTYFLNLRLTTKINEKGIRFQYSPWQHEQRKIKWNEIENWEIIDMPTTAEYSGWGVQFNNSNVYTVSGFRGLKLELTNGETVFIGSRKLTKLRELMKQMTA